MATTTTTKGRLRKILSHFPETHSLLRAVCQILEDAVVVLVVAAAAAVAVEVAAVVTEAAGMDGVT